MCITKKERSTEPKEVLINDVMYDVTDFKHPGGSIIKFLVEGGDATEAFVEFHGRSKKANAVLKSLKKRDATKNDLDMRGSTKYAELSKDYAALRKEFEEEGRFNPSMVHIIRRFSELIIIHTIGVYLFFQESFLSKSIGMILLGIGCGRCGWLMHEGGHYSLTGNITRDRALQIITYGVGCGMSAAWWRNQHNKHHATPQKLQHDVDLDTLPLVAFHQKIATKARNPILKAWLKCQAFLFFPVSCTLVGLGWQFFLHPRHLTRIKHTGEMAAFLTRYILWFGFVTKDYTWGQGFGLYVLYTAIASSYIFLNFALSHTHLPITNPDDFVHWVEYAAVHTTNINPGHICTWWMAHLNFQIEHHLFPSMPQFQHPKISPRVKALFEKHNLPYGQLDYFKAVGITLRNLHDVGNADLKKD